MAATEIPGFSYRGFYKRLCLCKLENKKLCEMSLEEISGVINAVDCFLPKKCVYCGNFTPAGKGGTCGIENKAIADAFAFCSCEHDLVPF